LINEERLPGRPPDLRLASRTPTAIHALLFLKDNERLFDVLHLSEVLWFRMHLVELLVPPSVFD
jgi:hypothetical protein